MKRHYPTIVKEESWVSTNRERALQLPGGNDKLGYDFVVNLPSYTLYFEVKSTSGEDFIFRLGPTEVEAAVRFSDRLEAPIRDTSRAECPKSEIDNTPAPIHAASLDVCFGALSASRRKPRTYIPE